MQKLNYWSTSCRGGGGGLTPGLRKLMNLWPPPHQTTSGVQRSLYSWPLEVRSRGGQGLEEQEVWVQGLEELEDWKTNSHLQLSSPLTEKKYFTQLFLLIYSIFEIWSDVIHESILKHFCSSNLWFYLHCYQWNEDFLFVILISW